MPSMTRAQLRKAGVDLTKLVRAKPVVPHTPFVGPVTIVVPFDALCPDNAKFGAMVVRGKGGKPRASLYLSSKYREAKRRIAEIAQEAMGTMAPAGGDVEVHFNVFWPDRRRRDMHNYAKLLGDALISVVWEDDTQIVRSSWQSALDPQKVGGVTLTIFALTPEA